MNCWTKCSRKYAAKNELEVRQGSVLCLDAKSDRLRLSGKSLIEERKLKMKNINNKKNKILVMMLIISMLVMALTACSGSGADSEPAEQDAIETEETANGDDVDTAESPEDSEDAESDSAILSPEFKKTMDDYEAWFDHYCEVLKKYQENPSDLELMSEMTDLLTEETEMLEQMDSMDESEMNSAELAYYIEVTARIEKKLLEVANY